jgi:hypothetical protein
VRRTRYERDRPLHPGGSGVGRSGQGSVRVDVVGAERAEALDVGVGDLDTGCFDTIERALGVDGVVEHARAQADPTPAEGGGRMTRAIIAPGVFKPRPARAFSLHIAHFWRSCVVRQRV